METVNGMLSGANDFFNQGMNYWLQYEAIQQGADFGGVTHQDVLTKPETTAPEPNPTPVPVVQPVTTVAGIPLPYIGIGIVATVGLVLLLKD